MSLTKVSLFDVVKKQYAYKLKAYIQVLSTLVFVQLLAILLSFNGIGGGGTSSESIEINIHYYSADFVIVFTMLWGFISAILITTKAYRYDDFAFVTNRISSNLSNAIFLLTASIIGGITAMLCSYLIKVIMYYFVAPLYGHSMLIMATPVDLLLGILATSFYVLLFCALGYFVGTLVKINKIFIVVLPAVFFGAMIGEGSGKTKIVTSVFEFIYMESSLPLFIVKIIVIAGLLFSSAFVLSNRMEVYQ
jgi:hypothetical protein